MAALSAWHERHEAAARAIAEVDALPAHVVLEVYSVLTRLPAGLAVSAADAAAVLGTRLDGGVLQLTPRNRARLTKVLADVGIFGGASYDGLVALEAHSAEHVLLTLDRRAEDVYRRLGIRYRAL